MKAQSAKVKRTKTGRLRFTMSDNSGSAAVTAAVFRNNTRLKKWGPETLENGPYYVSWQAPSRAQRLSFCVLAKDATGNLSKQSCAAITVS